MSLHNEERQVPRDEEPVVEGHEQPLDPTIDPAETPEDPNQGDEDSRES